jgi:hypothetical protein
MKGTIVEQAVEPIEPIGSSAPPRSDGKTIFVAMRHPNNQLYFGGQ